MSCYYVGLNVHKASICGNVAKINSRRESSSEAFRSGCDLKERGDKLRLPLGITSKQSFNLTIP
ncbi:MAG: hypothetical protein LC803_18595 [Acidobacteria bacterium]|nr:hypothetical protein [Acidobacteriota bacterium]